MYRSILIPVDNSKNSKLAEDIGVELARVFGSKITAFHVYSGKFHEFRFKVLEDYLPENYKKEDVLEYQRKIHAVLISRGLELISYAYMRKLREKCQKYGIKYEEKIVDGKNSDKIIEEARNHDLTVIGAQGLGNVNGSLRLGSNSRRVLRHVNKDILIVKSHPSFKKIFVCIDGSRYSYEALKKAVKIAKVFNSELKLLSCYDPVLHRTVFSSLVNVLSEEEGKLFRFKEQEKLHNEIIDRGLERLYEGYLEKGLEIVREHGLKADAELLSGKPYHEICKKAVEEGPNLIVLSRFGMHRGKYAEIGSNAENIAELANTNVLIVSSSEKNGVEKADGEEQQKEEKIVWSESAKKRLERIPPFARPMAMLAIERYAREKGYKVITQEVIEEAKKRFGM